MALGAILVWSGVAKLADRNWPAAAAAWGVRPLVAKVIAPIEIVLGAMLLTGALSPLPAAVAAALLLSFTVLVAVRVLEPGDAPPCACFGVFSRRPVSWRTVLRNVVLVGLAVVASRAG